MAGEQQEMTTAHVLGQFKDELTATGIQPETVTYLVQTAGRELLANQGLRIEKETSRDG